MGKLLPIALIGGALVLGRTAFNTSQSVQRLEYFNPRVRFGKLSLTNVQLTITMAIRNPGSADIPLEYFTGTINYGGSRLSSFTFDANKTNTVIKARSVTDVPFTVVISNLGAYQTIKKIITALATSQKVDTTIVVDGLLYAAGLDVPVKFSYDLATNAISMQGVGNIDIKGWEVITTWSPIDLGYSVYLAPSMDTPRKEWIDIGFQKSRPNQNDLLLMVRNFRNGKVSGVGGIDTKGTTFFGNGDDINDLDQLRKKFYKLSKKYHPDAGGTDADFQQLQNEYETLQYRLFNKEGYTKEQVDVEQMLDATLNAVYLEIMNIPGIVIEVVGKWLWISGNTYPVKDQIKAAGLKFASQKKMWYFAGTEHAGKGKPLDMDEIRAKYGSQKLTSKTRQFISGTANISALLEKLKFLLSKRK